MPRLPARTLILVSSVAGVLCLALYFWWMARSDPKINFLTSHSPAEWIQFPEVPNGESRAAIEVNATFRRSFVLQNVPAAAKLSIRAMKRWELAVNGVAAGSSPTHDSGWKQAKELNILGRLHPGTNEIVATVFNTNGPPAMWLSLDIDGHPLNSDSNWTVRLLDSVECNARPAATAAPIAVGNWLLGKETPLAAFRQHAVFFLSAILASALLISALWLLRSRLEAIVTSPGFTFATLAVAALLWAALFWNNLPKLVYLDGFDSLDHIKYILHIKRGAGLPLASEGWQMYQPPLYYILCSSVLDFVGPATPQGSTVLVRTVGLCIGIIHFTLIFLSLRMIFSRQTGAPLFGLVLAALLPAHLYISHYITNEALAAMLVTACFFFCLKIIVQKRDSWQMFLAVGISLGAALLAKVTAVIAVPFVAAALIDVSAFREPSRLKVLAGKIALAACACLAFCGWHYHRVWSHFGSPLVGNWDPAVQPPWWMPPGFQTWSYFFRFGQCLVHPWFSGFNGFADGMYSTLWGDALFGGRFGFVFRPPWNYQLMAAGFILSLVPTLFIAVGGLAAIRNLLRQPSRIWLLVVGVPAATLSALIYMNLKVPTYGEAKAFYGLIALLPLCAFAALGYQAFKRLPKPCLFVALVAFGVWGINSYSSFWIRTDSAEARLHLAIDAISDARYAEGLQYYAEAARLEPHNIELKALMIDALARHGQTANIPPIAVAAANDPLPDGNSHRFLAQILGQTGQPEAALAEARKSLQTAPDSRVAYSGLSVGLYQSGRYAEAISAAQAGERVDLYSPVLHFCMGRAYRRLGDLTNALMHLRMAVLLNREAPEMNDQFGLCLLAAHQWDEATNQFYKALQLRPDAPAIRFHLAAALAATGEPQREVDQYLAILQTDRQFVPALESLAWRLATSPDPALRDGAEAVQLAERACILGGTNDVRLLKTQAAAYARAEQFTNAITIAQQAVELALRSGHTNAAAFNQKLLDLYRANKAYVDETPTAPVISPDSVLSPDEK